MLSTMKTKSFMLFLLVTGPVNSAFSFFSNSWDFSFFSFPGKQKTELREIIEKEAAVNLSPCICLENDQGSITIIGWSKPAIKIGAIKRASSSKELKKVEPVITIEKDNVAIITKRSGSSSASIDYSVYLPVGAHITIANKSGSIVIDNLHGSITAETTSGAIDLQNVSGIIDVMATSGSIEMNADAAKKATITSRTSSGAIEIKGASGNVEAATKAGSIFIDHAKLCSDTVIDATTKSGAITLVIPEKSEGCLNLSTDVGKIYSQFSDSQLIEKKGWVGQEIIGKIGAGGAAINLATKSGSIHLLHKK